MRTITLPTLLVLALVSGCGGQATSSGTELADLPAETATEAEHGESGEHDSPYEHVEEHGEETEAGEHGDEVPAGATPLTGEAALAALRANVTATAARAEHTAELVEVTHILVAFEGARRSQVKGRTREQAEQRAADLLARTLAGEDFEAVRKPNSDDPGPPTYKMSLGKPKDGAYPRGGMAQAFGDVGWRLEVGQIGVAPHDPTTSPFGWHIIKRVK